MFLFKSLPQGLFRSEDANSKSSFRAATTLRDTVKSARKKRHRQKRDKITIQRNAARQHKAMTYDVIA